MVIIYRSQMVTNFTNSHNSRFCHTSSESGRSQSQNRNRTNKIAPHPSSAHPHGSQRSQNRKNQTPAPPGGHKRSQNRTQPAAGASRR